MTLSDEWITEHFDHLSPDLANELPETMARARSLCPVAHSDQHGGFWVISSYDEVVQVAKNWEAFTSTKGLAVLDHNGATLVRNLPVEADPPEQRVFKSMTNGFFTPNAVAPWEKQTRSIVTELIDRFAERGEAEFMDEFARPYPSLTFFKLAINAPEEDLERVAHMASSSSVPNHPNRREAWLGMYQWTKEFIEQRRRQPPKGDVVDAVIAGRVGDRPIQDDEIIGTVQLLMLGGLETTAGALGQMVYRLCREPRVVEQLRDNPDRMDRAVQELLRLDGSFVSVGRTCVKDIEIGGKQIRAGDKVLIHWASANRDVSEFDAPDEFSLDRESMRHVSFGIGVHRCTGSALARFNIRIALEEILARLDDLRLADGADVKFHAGLTRSPLSLPITFKAR